MNRKEWRQLTGGAGFSVRAFSGRKAWVKDWESILQESDGGILVFAVSTPPRELILTTLTEWELKQVGG